MTIVIVGSGPAGVFAALGALQTGGKVLMIDSGLEPELDAQKLKERLASVYWKNWTLDEYAALRATQTPFRADLSQKLFFGSDFATRSIYPSTFQEQGCRIIQSNARGGLSNVWGRGIEPPYNGECDHWRFKEGFFHSLQTVLSHIPLSAGIDNLAEVMPLYSKNFTPHTITKASEALLEKWISHETALNRNGIYFGRSRLAMRQGPREVYGCQLCSMCYYGCVYGALFDTMETISYLSTNYQNFEYKPGLLVKSFSAVMTGNVEVLVEDITEKKDLNIKARKLILAAGAAQTTKIVMRSMGIGRAVLKNSDLIKIPFLKIFGPMRKEEGFHSLSQLTLAVDNRKITKKAIVIHLFGENPIISDAALSLFPARWHSMLEKALSPLFCRLFIGMCFLHSDDSAEILVKDDGKITKFSSKREGSVSRIYVRLLWFLLTHIKKTGLLPIPGVGGVSLPGSSVHIGSSIPINGQSALNTDNSGRLTHSHSVYVADAASLPDIPAGSYTLSIMANAHRIGKIVGGEI